MRRSTQLGTAVITTVVGLALVPPANAVTAQAPVLHGALVAAHVPAAKPVPTKYALMNQAYGSRVEGNSLPVGSNTTSFEGIGCTNRAGLSTDNNVATAKIPGGIGTLYGVVTNNYTEQVGGTVASVSQHNIARLVLGQSALGTLEIDGLTSESRAFHDSSGFHSTTETTVATILLTAAGAAPVKIAIPTVGHPITIPGLVTIAIGSSHKTKTGHTAYAAADALDLTIIPTKTRVRVSHTAARIAGGVTLGTFRGSSNAVQVRALDDNIRSGPNPLSLMPCAGTYGNFRHKDLAAARVAKIASVSGARSGQMASSTNKHAMGTELAHVAKVDLGNGALVINAITAQANVVRGSKVTSDSKGTNVLSFTTNGKTMPINLLNGFNIPGLLKVETNVVTRTKNGIDVVAVRITLLNGTGAVIDLGHANMQVRPVKVAH